MNIFNLGVVVYMIGYLVQQAHLPAGRLVRLVGAVITIVGFLIGLGKL